RAVPSSSLVGIFRVPSVVPRNGRLVGNGSSPVAGSNRATKVEPGAPGSTGSGALELLPPPLLRQPLSISGATAPRVASAKPFLNNMMSPFSYSCARLIVHRCGAVRMLRMGQYGDTGGKCLSPGWTNRHKGLSAGLTHRAESGREESSSRGDCVQRLA